MALTQTLSRSRESCPRCDQESLHSTGAFWKCEHCGLAITQQALKLELAARGDDDMRAWRKTGSDGRA